MAPSLDPFRCRIQKLGTPLEPPTLHFCKVLDFFFEFSSYPISIVSTYTIRNLWKRRKIPRNPRLPIERHRTIAGGRSSRLAILTTTRHVTRIPIPLGEFVSSVRICLAVGSRDRGPNLERRECNLQPEFLRRSFALKLELVPCRGLSLSRDRNANARAAEYLW